MAVGGSTPGIGHQLRSVLLPPIRICGGAPGDRLRSSASRTGLTAFGLRPVYWRTAGNSIDTPMNPGWIGRPTGVLDTATLTWAPAAAAPGPSTPASTTAASATAVLIRVRQPRTAGSCHRTITVSAGQPTLVRADRQASGMAAPALTSALTDLVIITGFSGAGKSTAMAAFEDEGYFCVDNLPSEMIRSLVDLFMHEGSKVARAAVVSDVRGGSYFEGLATMLDDLRASGVKYRMMFLDADESTLLTRYKETRRRHPLAPTGTVSQGIARERELILPLRGRADVVIDTSGLTASMLRRKLADELF